MVPILGCNSGIGARMWNNHGYLIRVRHLFISKAVTKMIFFSGKPYFPSYTRNMFWATILYKYHEFNQFSYATKVNWIQFLSICEIFKKNSVQNRSFDPFKAFDRPRLISPIPILRYFLLYFVLVSFIINPLNLIVLGGYESMAMFKLNQ